MSEWERASARLKRLGNECRHFHQGPDAWPCFMCVTAMVVEYEAEIGALKDVRCDEGGWPLRDWAEA